MLEKMEDIRNIGNCNDKAYNIITEVLQMSQNIQVRMDESDKKEVEAIFNELGLSTTQAVKLFFKQVLIHQGLPFEVKLRKFNKETLEAIEEIENGGGREITFEELLDLHHKDDNQ